MWAWYQHYGACISIAESSLCPAVPFQALKAIDSHSLLPAGLVLSAHFHREIRARGDVACLEPGMCSLPRTGLGTCLTQKKQQQ